jgi:YfiH family protein
VALAETTHALCRLCCGGNRLTWYHVLTWTGSYAYASSLAEWKRLQQGVTLREGPHGPLNLSFTVTSDAESVRTNREWACAALGFDIADLVVPEQVHAANVAVVGRECRGQGALTPTTAIRGCDALVTNEPGLLLGITIADCLPIFCFDPIHHALGLAHSGWRGTAGRIGPRMLETMANAYGTRVRDCLIALGPGISPEHYEVDSKVYRAFLPSDAAAQGVFTPTRPGHWQLDLTAAVLHQLREFGIPPDHFDISPWRTDLRPDLFFSHRLVPGCGRMGAFLGLRA